MPCQGLGFVNGETLVMFAGQELGLATDQITISPQFNFNDIKVNAWGGIVPPEVQWMNGTVSISMNLINYDRGVVDLAMGYAMGGAAVAGQMGRAGTLLGQDGDLQPLILTSPVGNKPWKFPTTHLMSPPVTFQLGTEANIISMNFRAIPYSADPYNNGNGAEGAVLWVYSAT